MTFEQILVMYLYQNRKVSLNGFGTIELTGNLPDPEIIKKDKAIRVDGVTLNHNPKVATDEEFILFFAAQKGKIIPLAASDIETNLLLAKQMVNIGNPFDIQGIGQIVKQNSGNLIIEPGFYNIPPPSGSGRPVTLRERELQPELPRFSETSSRDRSKGKGTNNLNIKSILAIIVLVIAIGVLGWFLFTQLNKSEKNNINEMDVAIESTATQNGTASDSSATNPAILPLISNTQDHDTTTIRSWKAYFRRYRNLTEAENKQKLFNRPDREVTMSTAADSTYFELYTIIQSSTADTARKRDSLRKFFTFPVRLEPDN